MNDHPRRSPSHLPTISDLRSRISSPDLPIRRGLSHRFPVIGPRSRAGSILAVTLLAAGLAATAAVPAQAACPAGTTTKESKALGFALDGYAGYGVGCLRDIKARHGNCEGTKDCFRNRAQIASGHNGSWNIPPMSWAVNALDNGNASAKSLLTTYAQNQLTSSFGLWGKELTSWLYWWPLPTLGQVFDDVADSQLRGALQPLLQAHVGYLSLFSDGQRVLTPSVRTLPNSGTHDISWGEDYFFKKAVQIAVSKPTGAATNEWGWPYRVTDNLNHGYMSSTIRSRYAQNFWNGSEVSWVVAKLNALGVTTRSQVDIYRYQNGDYGTVLRQNLHGTKDPVYAVSVIGTTLHVLGPKRCSGSPQAWFDAGTRRFVNSCGDSIPAPPNTPLLYHVRIDNTGVTRVQ